ncbi:MAG TPA: 16S rRNA (adenine(1518)-N(6)/adenine(1519)-N(6))-dimethyltransferase RsmA [bacterium]|nr:16S rRNA (adenine(1518)-N(6)/adenine(1519)-N(6))-dimethyltransferase RsmA [bacterium]
MNRDILKTLLAAAGVSPRKGLSQNFLCDDAALERIADVLTPGAGFYVEMGGGAGSLTEKAVGRGLQPLTVLDIDETMLRILHERFDGKATVINADAVRYDLTPHFTGTRGVVFGNLPYQASSPILLSVLSQSRYISRIVFLLQREVAVKCAAEPASRDFSPLGALIRHIGDADILFDIGPASFFPPPKVMSSVLQIPIRPHDKTPDEIMAMADAFRVLFSHRRKTLANVFKMHRLPAAFLEEAGIGANARIEEIDWPTLEALAARLAR